MTAARAFRLLTLSAAVLVAVLAASGVWLSFRYEPRGIFLGSDSQAIGAVESHVDLIRTLHRLAAFVLVPVLIATAGTGIAAIARPRRAVAIVTGVALVVLGVLTALGGHRLAWNQIGIWSPTNTARFRGIWLGNEIVRFAIIDHRLVPITSFRREAWLHVLVMPLVLIGAGTGLGKLVRRAQRPD